MSNPPFMTFSEVRKMFNDFFIEKGHTFVPSSPVVPLDDPTLLFANSGMNQFKPIFLGQVDPKSPLAKLKRACNSQKCIRAGGKHNDLEDVGKDTYHHTFFEMLGNWSFGDYFKKEAIDWAWELLTQRYKLDPNRMYATYFGGEPNLGLPSDEEARELWLRYLPQERVLPFKMKENFWEMGETGPCGPCTEIHYDRIGGRDAGKMVNADDPTVIEIWNLVFMQFNREANGSLKSLPSKHVDTGMGLERVTSIIQGVFSNYDSDVFTPIFEAIQKVTGAKPYSRKVGAEDVDKMDMAYRVVADHVRTLTFSITDGAYPDKEGRNYVVRRILRRAVRYGRQILGSKPGFLSSLVPIVVELMSDSFPEIKQRQEHVISVVKDEEEAFERTLDNGLALFKKVAESVKDKIIPGDEAFKLHDTFGFPIDLTQLMAEERGMTVDMQGYMKASLAAIEVSKKGNKETAATLKLDVNATAVLIKSNLPPTDDLPKFDSNDLKANLRAIWDGSNFVQQVKENPDALVGLVFDRTNFYSEAGGQVGDKGTITADGFFFQVDDVQSFAGYSLHIGHLVKGSCKLGDQFSLHVDQSTRTPTMSNHTSTHILNFALRSVLGDKIDQKGSLVDPLKLRFDFSHNKGLSVQELIKIEEICNTVIAKNTPVFAKEIPLEVAKSINSLRAVFGETYPNPVRVVSIGAPVEDLVANPNNPEWKNLSIELCGGTHIRQTGEAKKLVIVTESAVAKGVRRIIALTGDEALKALEIAEQLAKRVEQAKSMRGEALSKEIASISADLDSSVRPVPSIIRHELTNEVTKLVASKLSAAKDVMKDVTEKAEEIAASIQPTQTHIVMEINAGANTKALDKAVKVIRQKCPFAAVLLVSKDEKQVIINSSVPRELAPRLNAGAWAATAVTIVGGKGGGREESGQGSGNLVDKVQEAIAAAKQFAAEKL